MGTLRDRWSENLWTAPAAILRRSGLRVVASGPGTNLRDLTGDRSLRQATPIGQQSQEETNRGVERISRLDRQFPFSHSVVSGCRKHACHPTPNEPPDPHTRKSIR